MRKIGFLVALLSVCLVSTSFADDAFITTSFDNTGIGVIQEWEHNEGTPFKGVVQVTLTNSGQDAWGDFHFQIYDPLGTQDISNVHFIDSTLMSYDGVYGSDPLYQGPLGFQRDIDDWNIDNITVGATMDLFFYNNPVQPGETVTLTVMTDNTQDKLSFFGVMIYPTPVPEPATMVMLGLGGLALLRKRK